ncbi:Regulatory protein BlaR1 [Rubripirellula lacrimiformis]|uniref:Regulatory protein BlaR1 n=1 Tax=Rubripirellula lacrimiformis TaxID=1930273 RepID=A0A517NFK5_9BACT|nr:M56 family metallopeptidase [Rubripirellula lacrimiformis]QDT05916.1 Regulatory protein BlaR1 [Rubripirellula lacrimiformis]
MDALLGFETVTAILLQVALVVSATVALQSWVGDARSGCRLWTTCFILLLALVTASLTLPHRRLLGFPEFVSPAWTRTWIGWQQPVFFACAVLWGTGVVVMLIQRVVRWGTLSRFLRDQCTPLTASQQTLLSTTLVPSDVSVLVSDHVEGPFCWQLHRPVIVLPSYILDDDATMLEHVLVHELAHLQTKHPMQHFLQGTCSVLFWFHPAVWWAAGKAELTREYLCDEMAAGKDGRYAAYLRTLVKIAERCSARCCSATPIGTLAFGNQPSALILRSNRIVSLAAGFRRPRYRAWVGCAALWMIALLASQVCLPVNAMASNRSGWSPWPTWTASVLHDCGIHVRDFESFDQRSQWDEVFKTSHHH